MALTSKPRRWPFRLHLAVRFLGLTGLAAAGVGLLLTLVYHVLPAWDSSLSLMENLRALGQAAVQTLQGPGLDLNRVAVGLLVAGGLFALLALLVEAVATLRVVTGRRSAFGTNAILQVVLAAVLLVVLNIYSASPGHHVRWDWTRDHRFTLPPEIQTQLAELKSDEPTHIVVYRRHKTLGAQSNLRPDSYDAAAERKVVDKVKDMVDQFRDFGPQFKVTVLDVDEEDFDTELASLPKDLQQAIDQAPENSIFFQAGKRLQRLSFDDLYQLDKVASQEANDGRGNLVLRSQGVEPFARKVLNIDERRPRVAVGVVHEVLSMEGGSEEIGMAGAKKALEAHGFDTRDVILKKWSEFAPPEPASFTFEESKLDSLDAEIQEMQEDITIRDKDIQAIDKIITQWQTAKLKDLGKTDLAKDLGVDEVTEEIRQAVLKKVLLFNKEQRQVLNEQDRKHLETLRADRKRLGRAEESLAEQRRLTDIQAKTTRLLADCDLLVIPRMTLFNVARGSGIPNSVYKLDKGQVEAIRAFIRSGKPVLVCPGPINEPAPGMGRPPDPDSGPDAMEEMLAQLGLHLSRETVLFNVESKAFAQRKAGLVIPGANVDVPLLQLEWEPGSGLPPERKLTAKTIQPNPLRESLRLTARSLGKNQSLDLRLRNPRPVYYDPVGARLPGALSAWAVSPDATGLGALCWSSWKLYGRPTLAGDTDATFLLTDAEAWNEGQPFATRDKTPRYEPPKPDDPVTDPYEKKRLGPFPVGVAVEIPNPYAPVESAAPTVRLAVIGHGGVFMGENLSAGKEKLLLDTCNWLLGRDDQLANPGKPWELPRVELTEQQKSLWYWAMMLGLPGLFAYLGLVVVMIRRVR